MATQEGKSVKANQADWKPTTKIQAVAASGALVAAVVTVATIFGYTVPDGLSQQATEAIANAIIVISWAQAVIPPIIGYLKKTRIGG